jgi:hypothetical protein
MERVLKISFQVDGRYIALGGPFTVYPMMERE